MNIFKRIVIVLFFVFLFYEVYAVLHARFITPELFAQALQSENIKLSLSDISEKQISALLAVEDPAFFNHNGIDTKSPGAGLTTITQSLTKHLYFKKFTPGFKKIEQSLIAWLAVSPQISKEDQLTLFINSSYLGHVEGKAIIGFDNASQTYYNKPFHLLTTDEYLSIVAMLIAPKTFHILEQVNRNKMRVSLIKKLLSGEYIPTQNSDVLYGQEIKL